MTDIAAALGIHQLKKLDGFIDTRIKYAKIYNKAFLK
jgi:dTDP-4-amino-4,6-dideoxygalactose transaminase